MNYSRSLSFCLRTQNNSRDDFLASRIHTLYDQGNQLKESKDKDMHHALINEQTENKSDVAREAVS